MATATQEQPGYEASKDQVTPAKESTEAETPEEAKPTDTVEPNPLLDKSIEPKAKALTMSRFQLAAEKRNVWRVEVEVGTTVEQVMDEAFWANVGSMLRPGDEIQVLPDDYSWRVDLHVAGAGRLYAHVVQLAHYKLVSTTAPRKVPSIYKVEFAGAHLKWRILRKGEPLLDGFATESLARRAAAEHQKAVDRKP